MDAASIVKAERGRELRALSLYRWVRNHLEPSLQAFAAVSALVAGGLGTISPQWMWLAIVLSASLSVGAIVVGRRNARSVTTLSDEVERQRKLLDHEREAIREALRQMAERFLKDAGLWTTTCRISVYGHEGEHLYLLARASSNPALANALRPRYPDNSGYIGVVWNKEEFFRSWKGEKTARKFSLGLGYTEDMLDALSMSALAAGGIRLESETRRVGAVLVESERKDEFDAALIDRLRDSFVCKDIADTVAASEQVLEELSLSRKATRTTHR